MSIDEFKSANWVLKKIRQHQQKIEEFEKRRDLFVKEYEARIADAKKNCELDCADHVNAVSALKDRLCEFALNNLEAGERTIRLPEGRLSFYASPIEFYFDDGTTPSKNSERLIDYLRHYQTEFVETVYKADWAKFKKAVKYDLETGEVIDTNGEVIEGLHVLKPADKFKVVLAGDNDSAGAD